MTRPMQMEEALAILGLTHLLLEEAYKEAELAGIIYFTNHRLAPYTSQIFAVPLQAAQLPAGVFHALRCLKQRYDPDKLQVHTNSGEPGPLRS
jgi:hypothetical protein